MPLAPTHMPSQALVNSLAASAPSFKLAFSHWSTEGLEVGCGHSRGHELPEQLHAVKAALTAKASHV